MIYEKSERADGDEFRIRLRTALGIHHLLADREVLEIEGQPSVHCEVYRYAPAAPVLFFLPGLGTYVELYAELLSRLRDQGFNIVAVDPRGHGYSGGERGLFRVGDLVADLGRILDRLQQEFTGPAAIFGYSGGAITALALAERDERVRAVLCGTLLISEIEPDLQHRLGWLWIRNSALFYPRSRVPLNQIVDFESMLDALPAGPLIRRDPRLVFEYPLATLASLFSQRSGILRQKYPFSLGILQGDRDEVLGIDYVRRVIARSKQPIDLILVAGEGHMLPWDRPATMAEYAGVWLKQALGI